MKRLALVLFVCLCLQVSGVSTPFAHLHADADHETPHHDGRVAHRHIAAHQPVGYTADHSHAESTTADVPHAGDMSSIDAAGESVARGLGSTLARLPHTPVALSPPDAQVLAAGPPGRALLPVRDVGRRVPRSPDLSSSSLRGPPR